MLGSLNYDRKAKEIPLNVYILFKKPHERECGFEITCNLKNLHIYII